MEISIQESKAEISIGSLAEIEGNSSQWRQLFQNLLANAIKFRKQGSSPKIEINAELITGKLLQNSEHLKTHYKFSEWNEDYYWSREKFCKITVRDYGIGFDPEYYERIFIAFERLHNLSEYEGTGIGLAICRKIAEFHNGMITAESSPDGTVFKVVVPVSQLNFKPSKI